MQKIALLIIIGLFLIGNPLFAQFKSKSRNKPNPIASSQWWIGVGGGLNLSSVQVLEKYHVLTPTSGELPKKDYQNFNKIGTQFNLMLSYSFSNISMVLQPGLSRNNFTYENRQEWQSDQNPENSIYIDNVHLQSFNYFDIPLKIRYSFPVSNVIIPFLQAGGYYSLLVEADKTIESTGVDNASGSANLLPLDNQADQITELIYPANYGLMAGAGLMVPVGDGMAILEANYHRGFRNIVNDELRYTVDKFVTGAYDVPDDWVLSNISLNFTFAIPLKFVTSKDFVPVNR